MDNHMESGNWYVAFQVKNSIFAVPMNDTLGIVAGGHNTTCTFLPNAAKHVKCIVEIDGLLISIVNLPGTYKDLPIMGNYIVVLEHLGQNIGILATEAHLVRILVFIFFRFGEGEYISKATYFWSIYSIRCFSLSTVLRIKFIYIPQYYYTQQQL